MFIFIRKNGYYASQKRLCKQPVLRGGIFIAFSKRQFEVKKSPKIQLYQYVREWLDTGKKFSGLIKKSACLLLPLNIETLYNIGSGSTANHPVREYENEQKKIPESLSLRGSQNKFKSILLELSSVVECSSDCFTKSYIEMFNRIIADRFKFGLIYCTFFIKHRFISVNIYYLTDQTAGFRIVAYHGAVKTHLQLLKIRSVDKFAFHRHPVYGYLDN